MSRCFPFPPPGYLRNSARRDALIESIKLRKDEMEKANKQREEKKAKKEKKREKKEKKERKHKGSTTSFSNDVPKKLKLVDQTDETKADGKLQKVEDCETELRERSGITEEHEQPASYREPCSSDSSHSSKRKRDTSLPPSHGHAPAIRRIRLPLRKHREPEERKQDSQLGSSSADAITLPQLTRSDRQLQCFKKVETKQSSSGNAVTLHQVTRSDRQLQCIKKVETKQPSGNAVTLHQVNRSDSQLQCIKKVETIQSSSGSTATLTQVAKSDGQLQCIKKVETKLFPGKYDSRDCKALPSLVRIDTLVKNKKLVKESRRVASLYDSLFQIKIPQPYELDSADQDWLFSSELTKEMPVSKKLKIDSAFQCSKSVCPRAQYIPEVEIYVLPYTVPF